MKTDIDFFERKIHRLESDIGTLHQELNIARTRLRSAEDYQIKYELLLRQSNHENIRQKKMQEVERQKFNKLLQEELEKAEKLWTAKMNQFEQKVIEEQAEQKQQLRTEIKNLHRKINEMSAKNEQMDALIFKNKKIGKQLESLEQIIEENKVINEKIKENQLKACKESITRKYQEKMLKEQQNYETKIKTLNDENQKMAMQLLTKNITQSKSQKPSQDPIQITSSLPLQINKFDNLLQEKNKQIEQLMGEKMVRQEKWLSEKQQLNKLVEELQGNILKIGKDHEVELFSLKTKMEDARRLELQEISKKGDDQESKKIKQKNKEIKQLNQELSDMKEKEEKLLKQHSKLEKDKAKLGEKVSELNNRLRDYEHDREMGETELIIASMKNIHGREDQMNNYENGVTFFERQLRKAAIKIEKKNDEVKNLINDITRIRSECDEEVNELKDKYYHDLGEAERKMQKMEEQIKQLNEELRNREKQKRDMETQFTKNMSKLKVQLRGLRNLNADLQRDYNRVLESKKNIDSAFREERERSITSKSQIANTKKQKWLQLQRQKNQIQIIYKEKQVQFKTAFNIEMDELRVERDKLKAELEMVKGQLAEKPQDIEIDKENVYSEYEKKLASINLQIGLTKNIYNTLIQAKIRVKRDSEKPSLVNVIEQKSNDESLNESSARFKEEENQNEEDLLNKQMQEFKKQLQLSKESPVFNMLDSFNPNFGK